MSQDLSKDTNLFKSTYRENPCHKTPSNIKLSRRKLLKSTSLGLAGGGLSIAQPARAEPERPVESTSSRMSYSRFLQYLEEGAVKKVDLFENGTVAISGGSRKFFQSVQCSLQNLNITTCIYALLISS
jgi:cell division protease FtsH